jgi:uncharacterized coiled-coil DUF342 family protein
LQLRKQATKPLTELKTVNDKVKTLTDQLKTCTRAKDESEKRVKELIEEKDKLAKELVTANKKWNNANQMADEAKAVRYCLQKLVTPIIEQSCSVKSICYLN